MIMPVIVQLRVKRGVQWHTSSPIFFSLVTCGVCMAVTDMQARGGGWAGSYLDACREMTSGRKRGHWIWYVPRATLALTPAGPTAYHPQLHSHIPRRPHTSASAIHTGTHWHISAPSSIHASDLSSVSFVSAVCGHACARALQVHISHVRRDRHV